MCPAFSLLLFRIIMKIFLLSVIVILQISCMTSNVPKTANVEKRSGNAASLDREGPSVLVYKTRKDYANYVPVLLSADKTRIISYPAPSDIKTGNVYQKPILLEGEYLLDKRGIGVNVAFLKLTYEEYALLPATPSKAELMDLIQDSDPLLELCNCGSRNAYSSIEQQLNELISSKELRKKCRVVK